MGDRRAAPDGGPENEPGGSPHGEDNPDDQQAREDEPEPAELSAGRRRTVAQGPSGCSRW